jgi:hypothetical protein
MNESEPLPPPPTSYLVECVTQIDGMLPEHRIDAIGGTKADGRPWRLRLRDAVSGLERGVWAFHVTLPDGRAVRIATALRRGRKYLVTEGSDGTGDPLFSLPPCPTPEEPAD